MSTDIWGWGPRAILEPMLWSSMRPIRAEYLSVENYAVKNEECEFMLLRKRPNRTFQIAYRGQPTDAVEAGRIVEAAWRQIPGEMLASVKVTQRPHSSQYDLADVMIVELPGYSGLRRGLGENKVALLDESRAWLGLSDKHLDQALHMLKDDPVKPDRIIMLEASGLADVTASRGAPARRRWNGETYTLGVGHYELGGYLFDSDLAGSHQWALSLWQQSPKSRVAVFFKPSPHRGWLERCTGGSIEGLKLGMLFDGTPTTVREVE